MNITSLNKNILSPILRFLPDQSVKNLGLTSKKMQKIAKIEMERRNRELQSLLDPFRLSRKFNVENIGQASLFLFGETHHDQKNLIDLSKIVLYLSNRGPVKLFLEGVSSMVKDQEFFEKKWICPALHKQVMMRAIEPLEGEPFIQENIQAFGWDAPIGEKEGEAKLEEIISPRERILLERAASLPYLFEQVHNTAFPLLKEKCLKDFKIKDIPSLHFSFQKIKFYHHLISLAEKWFFKYAVEKSEKKITLSQHKEIVPSCQAAKSRIKEFLENFKLDEERENQAELIDLLAEMELCLSLFLDEELSLNLILSLQGITYDFSHTEKENFPTKTIVDMRKDEILGSLFKLPFKERLHEALQELESTFSLLELSIEIALNSENHNIDALQNLNKFIRHWKEDYIELEEYYKLDREPMNINFPDRTSAMVKSIKSVRTSTQEADAGFAVVKAGALHLESRLTRKPATHFDLSPLDSELAHHHRAVIYIHSNVT